MDGDEKESVYDILFYISKFLIENPLKLWKTLKK